MTAIVNGSVVQMKERGHYAEPASREIAISL